MEGNFNRHLGSKLRMRRLALGLTQTKVAQAINVTFQQIQKYEKGTNGISSLRIMQLGKILKVPVMYFFEDYPEYSESVKHNKENMGEEDINYSFEAFNSQQDLPQIFQVKDAFDISRIYKIADEFEVDYIIIGNGDEYKQLDIIKQTDFSFILPLNFPESYEVSNPEEAENITLEQLKHWESAPFNPLILVKNDIAFSFTSSGHKNPKDFLELLEILKKEVH